MWKDLFFRLLKIFTKINSNVSRCEGHVARMKEVRYAYEMLVGEYEEKRSIGSPSRRWNYIRISLTGIGC
jgi:hypothetical protein